MRSSYALVAMMLPVILTIFLMPFARMTTFSVLVYMDKPFYNRGDYVNIIGNLSLDGITITNTFVGVQIKKGTMNVAYRTVNVGSPEPPFQVELLDVYLADSVGNRLSEVSVGMNLTAWVSYRNPQVFPVHVKIAYTIYDGFDVPIYALAPVDETMLPRSTSTIVSSCLIPENANVGIGKIYASAYSKNPENGGIPLSPEISSTFSILPLYLGSSEQSSQISASDGYEASFRLRDEPEALGTYTVYVSAFHYTGEIAMIDVESKTFRVVLLGDANGDGTIDIQDIVIIAQAFASVPSGQNWNPLADLNKDSIIDILDVVLAAGHFGENSPA